ncbi:MAG: PIN domain-containing protein [Fimbriimonadaceae bacterium]|nr:PIN domain-containing protein [Fimbriimonadaceae bacterium]
MTLCDVNVLVYAMRRDLPQHWVARNVLGQLLEEGGTIGWHPMLAASMVRVVTSSRVFTEPSSLDECARFVAALLSYPNMESCRESVGFEDRFVSLLESTGWRGPKVSDAYWATLALQHSATWVTFDRDFLQVPNLKLRLLP